VVNWTRDPDKALSYPGWRGRIVYLIDPSARFFSSDFFEGTGIHIGSGGGNGRSYSYSCELFLQDWRGLAGTAMYNKVAGTSLDDIV
jgi:hypothetical protein